MSNTASDNKGEGQSLPKQGCPCWIEVMALDHIKIKTFYSQLFPAWEFKPSNAEYPEDKLVMYEFTEPKGLSGGIIKLPEGHEKPAQPMGAGMTVYYFVENLEKTAEQVHALGGKTVMEKTPEGSNGWFMNFTDPEGNRFGAYEVKVPCGK